MKPICLTLGLLMTFCFSAHSKSVASDASHGCVECHTSGAVPDPSRDLASFNGILDYSNEQYSKVARVICMRIDDFKQSSAQAFEIKPRMCPAVPRLCAKGQKYLDMRGVVRYTVAQGLKIKDSEKLENALPAILSELMKHPCSIKSTYALSDVPFHNQRRNIAKRAIFTGQTASFFNHFLFNDYGYDENGKKKVKVDINAVEYVGGEPETLLDYVDKVLAPDHDGFLGYEQRGNVESLRDALISIGAKKASEL